MIWWEGIKPFKQTVQIGLMSHVEKLSSMWNRSNEKKSVRETCLSVEQATCIKYLWISSKLRMVSDESKWFYLLHLLISNI